jgi:hypothetical protein
MSRTREFAIAFLVGVALSACSVPRSSPWRTLDVASGESFTHPAAGAVFPPQIAKFQRDEIRAYDPAGRDISATYHVAAPEETVLATLYVYPAQSTGPVSDDGLKQHFDKVQSDVRQVHPAAMLIDERQVDTLENGQRTRGYLATFGFSDTFAGRYQPVYSSVYLYSHGSWFVKYRVTYPEAQRDTVEGDVKDFVASLSWSEPTNPEATEKAGTGRSGDVNRRFEHGWTLLMEAARQGDRAAADQLIARGAEINARAEKGYSALLIAIVENHTDIAKLLIEKGADVNAATDFGYTPLLAAMSLRDEELVQLLKKAGAKTGFEGQPGPPKYPGELPPELLRK